MASKIRICKPGGQEGTVFPANPLGEAGDKTKVFVYGFLLLYSFVGVSIVADMFLAAIERITSKKKRVKVPGTNKFVTSNVWNETVANLTLMALGSSAPEIMLAVNDIYKNKFHSGELGPSTIVGSAAFNLFVIIAVCINAIPSGETRQIKETGVFFITGFFSVAAYVWLLFIVQVNSPDIVSVTEGLLTFLFFPLLVWISWASDSGLFSRWAVFLRTRGRTVEISDSKVKGEEGVLSPRALQDARMRGRAGTAGRADTDDPTEEEEEELEIPAVCRFLAWFCTGVAACCRCCSAYACRKMCYICRRCRGRHQKKEDAASEDDDEPAEALIDLQDPNVSILDEEGEPIDNETGVISFIEDSMEVMGDLEEQQIKITILRKNGLEGRISCKYRMEGLTAQPGYDYVEEDGVVDFKNGVATAEIEMTILPKSVGERPDQFQIVLEEPTNEALFNPNSDGEEESCLMTVTILNANPARSRIRRFVGWIDGLVNLDEMRQGSAAWYEQVAEAHYCNGSLEEQEEAKFLDWVMHVIFYPWKMIYAIGCPPPPYLGGWVCFVIGLIHIGALTAIIGDMAELLGCAAGIKDNITAISVVALGTSLPDLFASKQAAQQDEWADASIVNVTGSNSVNVFLGIGVPWLMASMNWWLVDGSKDKLWMEKYEEKFLDRCPTGCFVVESGDLTFSVTVFCIGAVLTLSVIRIRRVVFEGELGGPVGSDSKVCSSFLLALLWFFYIGLCVWKSISNTDDWNTLILAIAMCIPIIIGLMIWFGAMLKLLKVSKEYIGEEGFFGIAVAVGLLSVRAVYFIVFQASE